MSLLRKRNVENIMYFCIGRELQVMSNLAHPLENKEGAIVLGSKVWARLVPSRVHFIGLQLEENPIPLAEFTIYSTSISLLLHPLLAPP